MKGMWFRLDKNKDNLNFFISADIEGVSDISAWDETIKNKDDYDEFRNILTNEINAVCTELLKNNNANITVKDAHDSGRNIIHKLLPKETKLIRGWANHPYLMMEGLDEKFDASIFIGYHSAAGTNGSPLAHTMNPSKIAHIKINNEISSEFKINYYTSLYIGVPVVLVTGDKHLCEEVKNTNSNIYTIETKEGIGDSSLNIHPDIITKSLKEVTNEIFKKANYKNYLKELPNIFNVEIKYINHIDAYKASFFPGATLKNINTISFISKDYFEVLKMFLFLT